MPIGNKLCPYLSVCFIKNSDIQKTDNIRNIKILGNMKRIGRKRENMQNSVGKNDIKRTILELVYSLHERYLRFEIKVK